MVPSSQIGKEGPLRDRSRWLRLSPGSELEASANTSFAGRSPSLRRQFGWPWQEVLRLCSLNVCWPRDAGVSFLSSTGK